uniref:C-type lectin domain-containing protein n=1 Tax=Neolamprologus brichardi TaxID=32507 RepID=A0A3Q4GQ97_NEOBR
CLVSMFTMSPGRRHRLAAVCLALLAAVLLILNIGLGIHCDGCKHCPAGWILMNSVCYYFPLKSNEFKTWKESRDFCQLQGGDLIIIDSQDEEVC